MGGASPSRWKATITPAPSNPSKARQPALEGLSATFSRWARARYSFWTLYDSVLSRAQLRQRKAIGDFFRRWWSELRTTEIALEFRRSVAKSTLISRTKGIPW